jgi:hypothetical protein
MITVVLLVEIRSAANVLMRDGRTSRGLDRPHAIESVLEDGRHANPGPRFPLNVRLWALCKQPPRMERTFTVQER